MSMFRRHDRAWAGAKAIMALVRDQKASGGTADLFGPVYRVLRELVEANEADVKEELLQRRIQAGTTNETSDD